MAGLSLKHAFVSGVPDNATSSEVQPSNWNAEHALTLDQFNLIGRQSAGNGPAEQLPTSAPVISFLAASTQLAMRAAMGQALTADIGLLQVTGAQIANATITAAQLAGITAQSMTVSALGKETINFGLTATVSGGSLTINLVSAAGGTPSITDPVKIVFRDATSGLPKLGTPSMVTVNTATNLVIGTGANLGVTVAATPFRGWLVAIDNNGTVILGAVVCTVTDTNGTTITGTPSEGTLISSTSIASGATTPGVIYASAGVSNVAFRVLGYFEYSAGLASAGVYSVAPTALELFGPGSRKPGDMIKAVYSNAGTPTITPTSIINVIRWSGSVDVGLGAGASASVTFVRTIASTPTTMFTRTLNDNTGGGTFVVSTSASGYDSPNTLSAVAYTMGNTGGSLARPSFTVEEIMA